ncbi:hypothetical protein B0T21DRAFT_346301 [Apiosordaria backusii]|uniref:Uncharacterized protein n=1 Tax=Apiosordaria backusii TaxID=314023 RepID=A0AA40END0_9PEZI|nr:hypothetical protein B0T21DRAFT_346301 [Apiosordaria backusii]
MAKSEHPWQAPPKNCEMRIAVRQTSPYPVQHGHVLRSGNQPGGFKAMMGNGQVPQDNDLHPEIRDTHIVVITSEKRTEIDRGSQTEVVPKTRRDWYSLLKLEISKNNAARDTVGFTDLWRPWSCRWSMHGQPAHFGAPALSGTSWDPPRGCEQGSGT